ncbi:MAG: hypothetical protein AAB456_04055, partial [Patescibacteria group bacterium]
MKKNIIIALVCLVLAIPLTTKARTLYDILKAELGFFPSVEERFPLADQCKINNYSGTREQNIELKTCLKNIVQSSDILNDDEEIQFGLTPPDKLSKTIREDISAGTNEATITVDPLVTLQGRRLTMDDIASTTPRLFFRIGSGDGVTWGYCTGMTDNTTTYDLTGCQLGLRDYGPGLGTDTSLINAHSAGEAFVITNSHHWFNYYLPDLYSSSTIFNEWTFPTGVQNPRFTNTTNCSDAQDICSKRYIDNLVTQGASTSTESLGGIS